MGIEDKVEKEKSPAFFVTANNLKVVGDVFLVPGIKLADEMNVRHRKFLVVAGADIVSLNDDSKSAYARDILFLNKDEILCTVLQEGGVNTSERKRVRAVLFILNDLSIEGDLIIPSGIRTVDALNLSEKKVIIMADARISLHKIPSEIKRLFEAQWVMISKRHIVFAHPVEEEMKKAKLPAGS